MIEPKPSTNLYMPIEAYDVMRRETKREAWSYMTALIGAYMKRPDLTEAEQAAVRMAWASVWAADHEIRRAAGMTEGSVS